jgi:hypothetical protein
LLAAKLALSSTNFIAALNEPQAQRTLAVARKYSRLFNQ